jgi:hypothetical protein
MIKGLKLRMRISNGMSDLYQNKEQYFLFLDHLRQTGVALQWAWVLLGSNFHLDDGDAKVVLMEYLATLCEKEGNGKD